MKELCDTINDMLSNDYNDRFRAEYWQLKIRLSKLVKMYTHWEELDFEPKCDKKMYSYQIKGMSEYLGVLRLRAEIEGIDLME